MGKWGFSKQFIWFRLGFLLTWLFKNSFWIKSIETFLRLLTQAKISHIIMGGNIKLYNPIVFLFFENHIYYFKCITFLNYVWNGWNIYVFISSKIIITRRVQEDWIAEKLASISVCIPQRRQYCSIRQGCKTDNTSLSRNLQL